MTCPIRIIVGSLSDWGEVRKSGVIEFFAEVGIPCEAAVISAHRNADVIGQHMHDFVLDGMQILIAAAGMMPGLPGTAAGYLLSAKVNVLGVTLSSNRISGYETLAVAASMPPGVPVAIYGADATGFKNAALAASYTIAQNDPVVATAVDKYLKRTQKPPIIGIANIERAWAEKSAGKAATDTK